MHAYKNTYVYGFGTIITLQKLKLGVLLGYLYE